MTDPETFGQWLKRRRKASDLTQEQLAKLSGCVAETIRKIEAGTRKPSKLTAELIAQALGIPRRSGPAWCGLHASRPEERSLSYPISCDHCSVIPSQLLHKSAQTSSRPTDIYRTEGGASKGSRVAHAY